jgi:hypothetical protein
MMKTIALLACFVGLSFGGVSDCDWDNLATQQYDFGQLKYGLDPTSTGVCFELDVDDFGDGQIGWSAIGINTDTNSAGTNRMNGMNAAWLFDNNNNPTSMTKVTNPGNRNGVVDVPDDHQEQKDGNSLRYWRAFSAGKFEIDTPTWLLLAYGPGTSVNGADKHTGRAIAMYSGSDGLSPAPQVSSVTAFVVAFVAATLAIAF